MKKNEGKYTKSGAVNRFATQINKKAFNATNTFIVVNTSGHGIDPDSGSAAKQPSSQAAQQPLLALESIRSRGALFAN